MEYQTHPSLNTSQRILHVYLCKGQPAHLQIGQTLLRAGKGFVCTYCGKPVDDVTSTPVGQAYFAFYRPDLGQKPS